MKWPYDPQHDLKLGVGWAVGWGSFALFIIAINLSKIHA